ncbi:MAG: hypothetical protein R2822_22550 [Spirosomataceae bacterium]
MRYLCTHKFEPLLGFVMFVNQNQKPSNGIAPNNPRNKTEQKLLADLLTKMKVKVSVLTDDDKESLGMAVLLKEADRSKKVTKEAVLQKLKAQ